MASGTSKMGGWPKTEISKMRGWRWEVDYPWSDLYSCLLEWISFAPHDSKPKIISKQYECPLETKRSSIQLSKQRWRMGGRKKILRNACRIIWRSNYPIQQRQWSIQSAAITLRCLARSLETSRRPVPVYCCSQQKMNVRAMLYYADVLSVGNKSRWGLNPQWILIISAGI